MKSDKPTDTSDAVRDAATQYAFNRWQSIRPFGLPLLGVVLGAAGAVIIRLAGSDSPIWLRLVALAAMVSSTACFVIFLLRLPRRARPAQPDSPPHRLWLWVLALIPTWALVFGVMWLLVPSSTRFSVTAELRLISLLLSAFILWMVRTQLRVDRQAWARSYSLSVQRDAGVVVGEFPFRKPKLWVWIAVPGSIALTYLLVWVAPVRFEPLAIVGGLAVFGLVKHVQDRRAFGLVNFLSFAPYWAYAVACAAGLPQPFADSALRIGIPLLLLIVPVTVACELYSRAQLRRLQRILKDEGQRARHAGD